MLYCFVSHSLHWHYIKTALQEYVIIGNIVVIFPITENFVTFRRENCWENRSMLFAHV